MRKIIRAFITLAILSLALPANSQVVNIPDSAFLKELIEKGVDTNGDGMIQVSEALAVRILSLNTSGNSNNLRSLEGIEEFINLEKLSCSSTDITEVDLSKNIYLKSLFLGANDLGPVIDLSSLSNIEYIFLPENKLSSIILGQHDSLKLFNLKFNSISSIEFPPLPAIESIDLGANELNYIRLNNLPSLKQIALNNNPNLKTINLDSLKSLKYLELVYCGLSEINLSNCTNLRLVDLGNNNLNELNIANLDSLERLTCDNNTNDGNISSLNLDNKSKLKYLSAWGHSLKSVDLSDLVLLEELNLPYNELTSIDLRNNPALEVLNLDLNELDYIDLSHNKELQRIYLSGNNISSLDLTDNNKIERIGIAKNILTELNIVDKPNLDDIFGYQNNLTSVEITNCPRLNQLDLSNNLIQDLRLSGIPAIEGLNISGNELSSIDLSSFSNLTYLYLGRNKFDSIDVRLLDKITDLFLEENNIKSIDLTNNTKLEKLDVSRNNIEHLDLLTNIKLFHLVGVSCDLISIDVSTADSLGIISISKNPDLNYICANLFNYSIINNHLNQYYKREIIVSLLCNGPINSFKYLPVVRWSNRTGDCSDDIILPEANFSIEANYRNFKLNIDTFSHIWLNILDDTISIKVDVDNTLWEISPKVIKVDTNYLKYKLEKGSIKDTFCLVSKVDSFNLKISIIPEDVPRAGFESCYKIVYQNCGTIPISDTIKMEYNNAQVKYLSSDRDTIKGDENILKWHFDTLQPLTKQSFKVCFKLNSPMDTPPLNDGDTIKFKATICPLVGDLNPDDNVAVLCQRVVNSKDPNDKICLEGATLTPDMVEGNLHYMIRFENLGTSEAVNIVVRDIIDTTKFDINSFRTVDASHKPYLTRVYDKSIVEFEFKDIYLPYDDENNDGYVVFSIQPKDDITIGDSLSNKADIYFDFNYPITTNNEITVVRDYPTFVYEFDSELDLTVYPNPSYDIIHINSENAIQTISIYALDGQRIMQEVYLNGTEKERDLDIRALPDGVYIVRIRTKLGFGVAKLVKK